MLLYVTILERGYTWADPSHKSSPHVQPGKQARSVIAADKSSSVSEDQPTRIQQSGQKQKKKADTQTTSKKEDKTSGPILLQHYYPGRDIAGQEAANYLTYQMIADTKL